FSSKYKMLQYIIAIKGIKVNKEFYNSIKILMTNRNIIAHSDSLLDFEITPIEENFFLTHILKFPRYLSPVQRVEPKIQTTLNNGQVQNVSIEKVHVDFI